MRRAVLLAARFAGACLLSASAAPAGAAESRPASDAPAPLAPAAQLEKLARRFVALERKRQLLDATAADVEASLAMLADAAVYEHPRFKARVEGKAALREGMLGHLGETRADTTRVLRALTGPAAVVLDVEQRAEVKDGDRWVPIVRRGLKVLQFEGTSIARILDYR